MAYSNRHRYQSRRERLQKSFRNWRLFFLFLLIASLLYIAKERVAIWDWFRHLFI